MLLCARPLALRTSGHWQPSGVSNTRTDVRHACWLSSLWVVKVSKKAASEISAGTRNCCLGIPLALGTPQHRAVWALALALGTPQHRAAKWNETTTNGVYNLLYQWILIRVIGPNGRRLQRAHEVWSGGGGADLRCGSPLKGKGH